MVFWRAKSDKPAAGDVGSKADGSAPPLSRAASDAALDVALVAAAQTNIVALASGRLAERLADMVAKSDTDTGRDLSVIEKPDRAELPGQKRALATMRDALGVRRPGTHLLVIGPPGTGRRTSAQKLAQARARSLSAPEEWIYVTDPAQPTQLRVFAFAPGDGQRFARDANGAIAKAYAMLERALAGDEHRMALDLLDEEQRHRGDTAIDTLRRRAEQQNIAVVKSLEGFVLAPMHDGKVVRPDVFRALPEALRRDVEAKITVFEGELQNLVAAQPDADLEADDKYEALRRQMALRVVKPNLAVIKKLYSSSKAASEALELVEKGFLQHGRQPIFDPVIAGPGVSDALSVDEPRAPVIFARAVTAADLCGEVGRDGAGALGIRPGSMMEACGGYLIVEAWRLAADPAGWPTLSDAIETGVFAPKSAPGVAVVAEPVPLTATVIVIADPASWAKLEAVDPGIGRHFRSIARFEATAPRSEVTASAFAEGAANIAHSHGLRAFESSAASALYDDALKRGGGANVSLDCVSLLRLLEDADAIAADRAADKIRSSDVEKALVHRAEAARP